MRAISIWKTTCSCASRIASRRWRCCARRFVESNSREIRADFSNGSSIAARANDPKIPPYPKNSATPKNSAIGQKFRYRGSTWRGRGAFSPTREILAKIAGRWRKSPDRAARPAAPLAASGPGRPRSRPAAPVGPGRPRSAPVAASGPGRPRTAPVGPGRGQRPRMAPDGPGRGQRPRTAPDAASGPGRPRSRPAAPLAASGPGRPRSRPAAPVGPGTKTAPRSFRIAGPLAG
jgi:hypothetical protein